MSVEDMLAELEQGKSKLSNYDQRMLQGFQERVRDGDPFDRQDKTDIRDLHDQL